MHQALVGITTTLVDFLQARLVTDAVLGPFFSTRVVSPATPEELDEGNQEGLSIWLYRVVRDDNRLNEQPHRFSAVESRFPPLPLRLHYLVTPFVRLNNVNAWETEQLTMGKVMQALHDHPGFSGADLAGPLSGADVEFHVRLETLSLEELARIWEALSRPYQLSISYEVAVALIDSERTERTNPVLVAEPRTGIVVA
jgi:Pvc16 N-terminal domain